MYMLKCLPSVILLFCFSTKVNTQWCLEPPVENLPKGCAVGNLNIINNHGQALVNKFSCNGTAQRWKLAKSPQVQFQHPVTLSPNNKNVKYLLTVIDFTSKQLLWMVSNITAHDNYLLPPGPGSYPLTVKQFTQPTSSPKNAKQVDFLLFEEHFNKSKVTPYQLSIGIGQSFVLTEWLAQQYTFNHTWCGPVAGGSILILENVPNNTVIKKPMPSKLVLKNNGFSYEVGNFLLFQILVLVLFKFL